VIRRLAAVWLLATGLASPAPAGAGDAVEISGDVLRAAIPLAAFGIAWYRDDRQGLEQFLWASGATVGATLVLKEVVEKDRPDGSDDDAFPSGHAATAFLGAAVLQRRYGWGTAWPAWLLAAWTGWTRVDADEHDWADVAGGAAVGVASAWIFVEPTENLRIAPAALPGGAVGIGIAARW